MPIDTSMYNNIQQPDFAAAADRGMRMGELIEQRRTKGAVRNAYKNAMTTAPDGSLQVNEGMLMKDLYSNAGPEAAMEAQEKFARQKQQKAQGTAAELDVALKKIRNAGEYLSTATDEQSWAAGRQRVIDDGLMKPEQIPEQFDPMKKDFFAGLMLSGAERLELERKNMRAVKDDDYRERELVSRGLDRKEARDERRFQSGLKMEEKEQALKTPFGLANTPDDAKQLKEAFEAKKNFDSKLNEMIELRTEYGGEALNREAVARGKQLSKDLLLEYKNMAKLGVLSQADEKIINAIIPDDPLAYRSPIAALQGQDPVLSNLQKFKADKDNDFETRVGTRTRAGIDGIASRQDSRQQTKAPRGGDVVDGYVFMGGDPSNPKSWMPATKNSVAKNPRKD